VGKGVIAVIKILDLHFVIKMTRHNAKAIIPPDRSKEAFTMILLDAFY